MTLVKLPVLRLDQLVFQSCEGKDTCTTCPLHNTFCRGVTLEEKKKICGLQMQCETNCNQCHGEDTARLIQGVCCKSPLREWAIKEIQTLPRIKYHQYPKLDFPDER